jgi:hypothetical protein
MQQTERMSPRNAKELLSNKGLGLCIPGTKLMICIVTCRWHILLDVSGIGSVANSMEMAVLSSDPKPLMVESFSELTGFWSDIRRLRDDGAGEYPGRTR